MESIANQVLMVDKALDIDLVAHQGGVYHQMNGTGAFACIEVVDQRRVVIDVLTKGGGGSKPTHDNLTLVVAAMEGVHRLVVVVVDDYSVFINTFIEWHCKAFRDLSYVMKTAIMLAHVLHTAIVMVCSNVMVEKVSEQYNQENILDNEECIATEKEKQ